jgi:hypothetical protein
MPRHCLVFLQYSQLSPYFLLFGVYLVWNLNRRIFRLTFTIKYHMSGVCEDSIKRLALIRAMCTAIHFVADFDGLRDFIADENNGSGIVASDDAESSGGIIVFSALPLHRVESYKMHLNEYMPWTKLGKGDRLNASFVGHCLENTMSFDFSKG